MKTTKFFGLVFLFIFSVFGTLFAQTETSSGGSGGGSFPDSLQMIKSFDMLRNYALGISKYGERWVNGTIDYGWEGNKTFTSSVGNFGEEVLQKIINTNFVYRLKSQSDILNGYINLYDKEPSMSGGNFNMLFWGKAEYEVGGQPRFQIWMQDVPLPVYNVSSAEVLVFEDGKNVVGTIPLTTKNGRVLFKPYLAGATNGLLAIKLEDNNLITYSLSSPGVEKVSCTKETNVMSYKIDGHYVYEDPNLIDITEIWNKPSAFIFKSFESVVVFDVIGVIQNSGSVYTERPAVITIESEGGIKKSIELNRYSPTSISITQGKWRITFDGWVEFGKSGRIYAPTSLIGVDGKGL